MLNRIITHFGHLGCGGLAVVLVEVMQGEGGRGRGGRWGREGAAPLHLLLAALLRRAPEPPRRHDIRRHFLQTITRVN